jgi:hypothetical protein
MNPVKSSSSIVLVAIPFWWILQDMSIVKEELIKITPIGFVFNIAYKAQNVVQKRQQMAFKSQNIQKYMLILLIKELQIIIIRTYW